MTEKKEIKKILIIFLFSRLLLIGSLLLSKNLSLYDSIHYINIAKYGYIEKGLYAFFPLYPILIRILHVIIPSYYISGIILSNIFSLISTFVIYHLVDNKKHKMKAVILFLFSPILPYTTIIYTESLYLLLTLLSYLFYKKKNYLISGILVGLSMLTRNTGIILLGAYGLDLLIKTIKKENTINNIIKLSIPAILIGSLFSIYLYIKTNNPFMYIIVQKTEWYKDSTNIIDLLIRDIKFLIQNKQIYIFYILIQNWLFLLLGIIYSIKYIKKEFALSIYTIVSIIAFTITCRNTSWDILPSISLFRYVLSLFSIYLYPFLKEKYSKLYYIPYTFIIIISIINTIFIYLGLFMA